MSRSYAEELQYIEKINDYSWRIKKGFVPNMNVILKFDINKFCRLEIDFYIFCVLGGGNILCQ